MTDIPVRPQGRTGNKKGEILRLGEALLRLGCSDSEGMEKLK